MPASKATPETFAAIIGAVRAGASEPQAARAARIHPDCLRRWKRQGEAGQEPFATFVDDLAAAVGESLGKLERSLYYAAMPETRKEKDAETGEVRHVPIKAGDVRAAMFLLERRDPETWGASINLKVQEKFSGELDRFTSALARALMEEFGDDRQLLDRVVGVVDRVASGGQDPRPHGDRQAH